MVSSSLAPLYLSFQMRFSWFSWLEENKVLYNGKISPFKKTSSPIRAAAQKGISYMWVHFEYPFSFNINSVTNQLTNRPTDKPTNRPTNEPTNIVTYE